MGGTVIVSRELRHWRPNKISICSSLAFLSLLLLLLLYHNFKLNQTFFLSRKIFFGIRKKTFWYGEVLRNGNYFVTVPDSFEVCFFNIILLFVCFDSDFI